MIKFDRYDSFESHGWSAIVSCDVRNCEQQAGHSMPDIASIHRTYEPEYILKQFADLGWHWDSHPSQGIHTICPKHQKLYQKYEEKLADLRWKRGQTHDPHEQDWYAMQIKRLMEEAMFSLGPRSPMPTSPSKYYATELTKRLFPQLALQQHRDYIKTLDLLDAYARSRIDTKPKAELLTPKQVQNVKQDRVDDQATAAKTIIRQNVAQGLARPHHCNRPAGRHPGYLRVLTSISGKVHHQSSLES